MEFNKQAAKARVNEAVSHLQRAQNELVVAWKDLPPVLRADIDLVQDMVGTALDDLDTLLCMELED